MDNCHFTFGEKLFRQIVGIPMGSDPAPFMANLFLYHFENKTRFDKINMQFCKQYSRLVNL